MKRFLEYKKQNPRKMVLVHYNNVMRHPRDIDMIDRYSAGHWLHFVGSKAVKNIEADPQADVIFVDDIAPFEMYDTSAGSKGDDITICRLLENGRPDWNTAEQAYVVQVNKKEKSLKVQRGMWNTKPLSFEKGKTYVAPHVFLKS